MIVKSYYPQSETKRAGAIYMPKKLVVSAGQSVSVMNEGAPMIEIEVARSGHDRFG